MKTTEQLVKIAFYKHISYQVQYYSSAFNTTHLDDHEISRLLAKAARRFVKAEQRQMSVDKLDDEIQRLMHLANSKERKHK